MKNLSIQKKIIWPGADKYVVAVSGGVDSVSLLHMLVGEKKYELIVAHFDHGIRHNSKEDCDFVAKLAKRYGLQFEQSEGKLGENATEEQARNARYNFFNSVAKKNKIKFIITAQHLDDAVETLIFNVLRGTSTAGLAPFNASNNILRPLRNVYKEDVISYAKANKLAWREDETNLDLRISRNYIRHVLLPLAEKEQPGSKQKLAEIISLATPENSKSRKVIEELYNGLAKNRKSRISYQRSDLLLLSSKELLGLMSMSIQKLQPGAFIDTKSLKLLELFTKIATPTQQYKINNKLRAISGRVTLSIALS